jgi:cell division septation protein DedD
VGNRQLLSGFFVVVLLFAVAFAMGYMVGQNVPRASKTADASAGGTPVMDRPLPTTTSAVPPTPPVATPEQAAASQPGDNPPAPLDRDPAQPGQPSTQPPPPATPATNPAAAAPAAEPPATQAPAQLQPGTCWQVMSVGQSDAVVVVRALKDKGFPAFTTPGPNKLTRILVGPYDTTQAMAHAKTELEAAGFHPIRK